MSYICDWLLITEAPPPFLWITYCDFSVQHHTVIVVKREEATQQSEQQHTHAPDIRLEERSRCI